MCLCPFFLTMALRKEGISKRPVPDVFRLLDVFTSKVLQKLYPAAPMLQEETSSATINTNVLSRTPTAKRTTSANSRSIPSKRIYTALPPPADYKTDAQKSVTLSAPETLKSAEDPAERSEEDSSNETDQATDPEVKKRRRRRKKRKDHAPAQNQTAVNDGEERMNKNKKRKLKKKRHKEKLLSMGLVPRAAAVEFTYQRGELRPEEGDKEEEGRCQVDEPGQDCSGNP